jgi:hypothetical protein
VIRLALLALLALALVAAPAAAAPFDELPQRNVPCPGADLAPAHPPARAAGSGPSVRKTIRDAAAKDAITPEDAERYERAYREALAARARLRGTRRAEMAGVVRQLETFARQRTLTVARMPVLILQLERNTAWWSKNAPPPPPKPDSRPCAGGTGQGGARVIHEEMVFQWYGGQGLQIQQLATAGRANALVKACIEPNPRLACDRARVKTALDGLVRLSVDRGGVRGWEYYFAFGGGRPPWVSGLAQGTAMQALARGSQVLGDASYLDVARQGVGVFARRPPQGVRVPAGDGAHFLIYSFNRNLRVLNGFLQALVGLYDYAEIADDDAARALFRAGERRARQEVPGADTGAWSRYSAGGAESDLGYHQLVRDFLRSMCERTKGAVYCATADRFHRYLREKPGLRFLRAGRNVRFFVTKVSCVTLTVRRGGRIVARVTRVLGRGARTLSWTPRGGGSYRVEVQARDLASNVARIRTTVRTGR